MDSKHEEIKTRIIACFKDKLTPIESPSNELVFGLKPHLLREVATELKENKELLFEQLTDLCGIDYLTYGIDEWTTKSATNSGFSRGVTRQPVILDDADSFDGERFAVIYNLLSLKLNIRIRLRMFTGEDNPPILSLIHI